jgi:hypothetical protein
VSIADEARAEVELIELRDANARLSRQLVRAKAKVADLVDATYRAALDAAIARPAPQPVPPPKDRRRGSPEVALWHMTDWQGSKTTASYNSAVCEQRVMRFCDKAEKITQIQRQDHPVREALVVFSGDMIEGLFNFPGQPFEIDQTLFGQWDWVSDLLAGVVRRALACYERVTVVPEWGNHGRIGSKRDAVPRSDNLDRMCYRTAQIMLRGVKNLTWQDCPEDIQRLEVGNYRALVIHGDEVGRNGFASPATIVQHVNRWRSGSYPWPFRDVYMGHYHSHAEWPLANGEGAVYQTGSTESDNRYAGVHMAATSVPSQRLHFIDPDAGRVAAQYKVWLS